MLAQLGAGFNTGIFIAGFQGLDHKALLDTAMSEGKNGTYSPLAWEVSSFLSNPEFPHVVGVGFLSAANHSELPNADEAQGVAYYFPKRTTTFWHPQYSGLFGHDHRGIDGNR